MVLEFIAVGLAVVADAIAYHNFRKTEEELGKLKSMEQGKRLKTTVLEPVSFEVPMRAGAGTGVDVPVRGGEAGFVKPDQPIIEVPLRQGIESTVERASAWEEASLRPDLMGLRDTVSSLKERLEEIDFTQLHGMPRELNKVRSESNKMAKSQEAELTGVRTYLAALDSFNTGLSKDVRKLQESVRSDLSKISKYIDFAHKKGIINFDKKNGVISISSRQKQLIEYYSNNIAHLFE